MNQHDTADTTPQRRWNRKRVGLTAAFAAVVIGGGAAAIGVASAATTTTPSHPYIVGPGPATLNTGDTDVLQISGQTFGGTTVPSNANGVTVSLSDSNPSHSGSITVFTTGTTRPSTATLSFGRHDENTTTATVPLSNNGKITVYASTHVGYTLRLLSYSTPGNGGGMTTLPVGNCDSSTINTIAPSTKTLTNVGGSIRTGATDFGSVTLPAGTYDTRVIGGFTGLNNSATFLPSNVFLTGTLVVVKGATINSSFSNDVTDGGVVIPKSNSATLTQDPTLAISTFLTLNATTDVHVKLFAYASDSSSVGSGQLQGNIQSAQFRKVCASVS